MYTANARGSRMHSNDWPVVGQALSPANCIFSQLLTRIYHTQRADVAQGVPSGPVPAVSNTSVGMSADAAGRSACATSMTRKLPSG